MPTIPSPTGPRGATDVDRWRLWWHSRAATTPEQLLARRQGWVIRADQLRALGLERHDVRRLVRRGEWSVAARGVVCPLDLRSSDHHLERRRRHAVAAAAAVLLRPDHVVDGRSAAVLHGLPTGRVPELPELAGPPSTGRRAAARVHALRLRAPDVTTWCGAPVVTPARAVVDLARRAPDDGIMAADAALRAGIATCTGLVAALEMSAGWPGVRRAREVIALASPLSESPLESVTRLRLFDSGFPAPSLQAWIGEYRVDLFWRQFGVVLECDGRVKYTADALWQEKRREAALRRAGCVVDRVIWSDVVGSWDATVHRLATLFPAGAVTVRTNS